MKCSITQNSDSNMIVLNMHQQALQVYVCHLGYVVASDAIGIIVCIYCHKTQS